jgi:1A family penicillin-binding protein
MNIHKNQTLFAKIFSKKNIKKYGMSIALIAFVFLGFFLIWFSTIELPDLNNFENRVVAESTKIYDRTGKVVLFDVHGNVRRTVVPLDQMTDYVKWATIAIEDKNFYTHHGVEPKAILRAVLTNLKDGNLLSGQGGSTITQQIIKNALLTSDKKISRKIKEWVLAPRLEAKLTKDEILELYLNEVPYGGTVYGVQEAGRRFFGKDAKDLSIVESAYIAALPQAPTYYSPYGSHRDELEKRKNKVLREMLSLNFITQQEYDEASKTSVEFQKQEDYGIKAPHFVMYIRELLEEKYGAELIEKGGLKVITTLDWELQKDAEEIVKKWAFINKAKFDAENAALVVIDPNTGQILTMVGSRDYFDEEIDGNFNIATASRQPGSSIKPVIYAEAFTKGYRPETVVFDLPTEFSTTCYSGGNCYSPQNYDDKFRGPLSLRDALAQSLNVPAVKVLYLAGIEDSLTLAKQMGLETLTNAKQYGLTLVLGGGEVRPLDLAGAYAVFATDGIKHPTTGVLKIEDGDGKKLEEFELKEYRVISEQVARLISSILSDNVARTPSYGSNSPLYFGDIDVAAKTGTTNDYRDTWIVGYTPNLSVLAWAGNNDNRSILKNQTAGFVIAPMWNEFMQKAIAKYPASNFIDPEAIDPNTKPVIRGVWENPLGVHEILHWVKTSDPLGPPPNNPASDSQYILWEEPVQKWLSGQSFDTKDNSDITFKITNPEKGKSYDETSPIYVTVTLDGSNIESGKVYLNGKNIGELDTDGGFLSFIPDQEDATKKGRNTLKVVVTDTNSDEHEDSISFELD